MQKKKALAMMMIILMEHEEFPTFFNNLFTIDSVTEQEVIEFCEEYDDFDDKELKNIVDFISDHFEV